MSLGSAADTETGTAGCDGAKGSSEGHEEKDAALFFGDWGSEYLMVDSCGVKFGPPYPGPASGGPHAQARWEMTLWSNLTRQSQARTGKPIILHDCHNGCGSGFAGATLAAAPCNRSDPAQWWGPLARGAAGGLSDGMYGLCAGCGSQPGSCGNSAKHNGTGVGVVMQACITHCSGLDVPGSECAGNGMPSGIGSGEQIFNYSVGQ